MLTFEWFLSIAIITLLVILIGCTCGCRKKVPKNELLGLAGNVKITNPEETMNHNNYLPGFEGGNVPALDSNVDHTEASRRTATTANRSLPEIPVDSDHVTLDRADTLWENNEPNGDTCSELYATVEENKIATVPLVTMQPASRAGTAKLTTIGSGIATSDDGKSSDSQTDDSFAPYAQVKSEHPYDRLKKSEHPYAQVRKIEETSTTLETIKGQRSSAPAGTFVNPVPPPRTRKSNSFNCPVSSQGCSSVVTDIPAATAIAGRISANQELPYMTPPIPATMASETQTHFSGDSQDSSKGYTSISVREPLANIKAQTSRRSQTQEHPDSYYTTVSDDSEEMYAAIEDPQQVYTSGSETYEQIPPLAVVEPIVVSSNAANDVPHYPPQPPSVDSLKHVAQVHSRQASSSSAASSVVILGSPKPEKRQANSPLPPPPAGSPELYATVDKKNSNRDVPTAERTVEEMYAKVIKKNQRRLELAPVIGDEVASVSKQAESFSPESDPTIDDASGGSIDISSSRESIELCSQKERAMTDIDAESICSSNVENQSDFSYKSDKSDSNNQHPYYQLTPGNSHQPNYLNGDVSNSIPYIDPGYEIVQRLSGITLTDNDPNYEELRPQVAISIEQDYPSYSTLNSDQTASEPGYASIGHNEHNPGYERVGSREEPGYASIRKNSKEPDYESMQHVDQEASSVIESELDPNYETVFSNVSRDPPYARLHNESEEFDDTASKSSDDLLPKSNETEYEEVNVRRKSSGNGDMWGTGRHKLI